MNKKIIYLVTGVLLIAIVFIFNYNSSDSDFPSNEPQISKVEANADIDPDCPNGCIDDKPTGCYCYGYYPQWQEFNWGD